MNGWRLGVAAGLVVVACTNCSSKTTSPKSTNSAPTVTSVSVSPTGKGIQSATAFTFVAQGATDLDGDTLTYTWRFGDGGVTSAASGSVTHVFSTSGTFAVSVTVTDPSGLSASSTGSVSVGNVTGVWDVSCTNRSAEATRLWPNFPSNFVVTLSQSGALLTGSMSGAGISRNFNFPGGVADPRSMSFGVETISNAWANLDGDFYFRLVLDSTLNLSTSGSAGFYCGSSVARKR